MTPMSVHGLRISAADVGEVWIADELAKARLSSRQGPSAPAGAELPRESLAA
jgi:hypothetical protein